MPTVPIQMLNSVCKDFGLLNGINFSQIRDNRIGILKGADAFTATVPLKYTIGQPGTPYGVLTQLGWTITGPVPNKYRQLTEKNKCNRHITLFDRVKSEGTNAYWTKTCSNYFGPVKEQSQQKLHLIQ